MWKRVIVIATAVTLAGCSVVQVSEKASGDTKSTDIDGIPFYVKVEKFKRITTYTETWLRATLTVEKKAIDTADKKEVVVDAGKQPYVMDIPKGSNPALTAIKKTLLNAETEDAGTAEKVIDDFQKLAPYDHSNAKPERVSNDIESEWVVDRSKTYYINAPLPWFGSASLTQKLAPDGTLTEVTSTPDTKLAEGLSTLIPFKEFLSGKFVESVADATEAAPSEDDKMKISQALQSLDLDVPVRGAREKARTRRIVFAITLTIEEVGYEYTLSTLPQATPFTDLKPLCFKDIDAGKVLFARKDIAVGRKEEDKKQDGQKIGIAGSISLPKEWGTSGTEKAKD
jgi:hypothetical protein